jgi:hypothetical protein
LGQRSSNILANHRKSMKKKILFDPAETAEVAVRKAGRRSTPTGKPMTRGRSMRRGGR